MKLTFATVYLFLAALGAASAAPAPGASADGVAPRDIDVTAVDWEHGGKRNVYEREYEYEHEHEDVFRDSEDDAHTLAERAFRAGASKMWQKSADWYFNKALDLSEKSWKKLDVALKDEKERNKKVPKVCANTMCVAAPKPAPATTLNAEFLRWKKLGCNGQKCSVGVNLKKKICVGVKGSCSKVLAEVRKLEAAKKNGGGTGTTGSMGSGRRVSTPGTQGAKYNRLRQKRSRSNSTATKASAVNRRRGKK